LQNPPADGRIRSSLTTAHILYRRPDHRWLLQSYVWQNYDLFPEFPELRRFLAFWQEKLEGPLHSVRVAHCKLIKPAEIKAIDGEFRLQQVARCQAARRPSVKPFYPWLNSTRQLLRVDDLNGAVLGFYNRDRYRGISFFAAPLRGPFAKSLAGNHKTDSDEYFERYR
jgi:uncharacterized protein Usg